MWKYFTVTARDLWYKRQHDQTVPKHRSVGGIYDGAHQLRDILFEADC